MARKTAQTAQEILMADFQTLVSDTEKLLDDTAILAGDQADELRSKIHESLLKARETLQLTEDSHAPAVMQRQVVTKQAQDVTIAVPNRRIMATFFISLIIIWVMYEQWVSNLSVYMTGMGIPMREYSLLWTINAGLIVVFQALLNWLANFFSNLYLQVYAGIFFVALSFVTLIFAKDYLHFVIAMVILTMGEATAFPAIPAIVNGLTPHAVKGKYQGMANAWANVGKAFGPLFGGLVIDHGSYTLLFIIAAVANLLILGLNGVVIHANQQNVETYK